MPEKRKIAKVEFRITMVDGTEQVYETDGDEFFCSTLLGYPPNIDISEVLCDLANKGAKGENYV